jgi:hypothetical protein
VLAFCVQFRQVQFVLGSARLGIPQSSIGPVLAQPGVPGGKGEEWD